MKLNGPEGWKLNTAKFLSAGNACMAIDSDQLQALKRDALTALGSQQGGRGTVSASAVPMTQPIAAVMKKQRVDPSLAA